MKTSLRLFACALLGALLASGPARATTYSIDYSDQWWNANESGWGLNLIQQGEVMFGTLFVYDPAGTAHWYSTTLTPAAAGSQSAFSGSMTETFGPWFGSATFNPNGVGRTSVGSITLTFSDESHGNLDYFVNGVHVTKAITRQTWRLDSLAGDYLGGLTAQGTNCSGTFNGAPVTNGPVLIWESLNVQQTGTAATLTALFTSNQGQPSQCVFIGTYGQAGRLGSITGNWSCTLGTTTWNQGTFTVSQIQSSPTGFSGTFSGRDQYCTYSGQFGGVRDISM